jgi:NAD-dependent deacetylase
MNPVKIPPSLIERLRSANHVAILSGAGTSAESGVPTFREAQSGLWAQYDPQELATPQAFRRNPKLVWDWYAWRRELVSSARPNEGHLALVELAKHVPRFSLITQNVDGLHQLAGSSDVIELHGNIRRTKCSSCGMVVVDYDESGEGPPHCPACDAYLRPDVVWYGENLPEQALGRAFAAARSSDLFFSIGTSALVQPAASLPIEALQHGATVVEINPQRTPLSAHATFQISGPSGVVLPELLRRTWPAG